jgi:cell division cycle 2-like protein
MEHPDERSKVAERRSDANDERSLKRDSSAALPPVRHLGWLTGCRSVDCYQKLNRVQEGTYGVVYRAQEKTTGEIVALKRVKMEREREGFPITSLREIKILMSYKHPNIVDVKEIVVGSKLDHIYIVMEFLDHDLKGLMEEMKPDTRFLASEVKCLMLQLLSAVNHLHKNWILHRDLKTSNLLFNNKGILKVADFGYYERRSFFFFFPVFFFFFRTRASSEFPRPMSLLLR